MAKAKQLDPETATGGLVHYVPAGPLRTQLLGLVRIGVKFKQQHHAGRRPGFLHGYIVGIVGRMESPETFERLLEELEFEASRRNQVEPGEPLSPVESVNRVWETVRFQHPSRGENEITFATLRNYLTEAKRIKFPASPKR